MPRSPRSARSGAARATRSSPISSAPTSAYRRLRITLTTHSAGGLTQRDFALARTIDTLSGA
ncbi:MAG: 4a-hydroxytetrahydrobiopterin dehydratase [Solirubrobacteraceae bacterium]